MSIFLQDQGDSVRDSVKNDIPRLALASCHGNLEIGQEVKKLALQTHSKIATQLFSEVSIFIGNTAQKCTEKCWNYKAFVKAGSNAELIGSVTFRLDPTARVASNCVTVSKPDEHGTFFTAQFKSCRPYEVKADIHWNPWKVAAPKDTRVTFWMSFDKSEQCCEESLPVALGSAPVSSLVGSPRLAAAKMSPRGTHGQASGSVVRMSSSPAVPQKRPFQPPSRVNGAANAEAQALDNQNTQMHESKTLARSPRQFQERGEICPEPTTAEYLRRVDEKLQELGLNKQTDRSHQLDPLNNQEVDGARMLQTDDKSLASPQRAQFSDINDGKPNEGKANIGKPIDYLPNYCPYGPQNSAQRLLDFSNCRNEDEKHASPNDRLKISQRKAKVGRIEMNAVSGPTESGSVWPDHCPYGPQNAATRRKIRNGSPLPSPECSTNKESSWHSQPRPRSSSDRTQVQGANGVPVSSTSPSKTRRELLTLLHEQQRDSEDETVVALSAAHRTGAKLLDEARDARRQKYHAEGWTNQRDGAHAVGGTGSNASDSTSAASGPGYSTPRKPGPSGGYPSGKLSVSSPKTNGQASTVTNPPDAKWSSMHGSPRFKPVLDEGFNSPSRTDMKIACNPKYGQNYMSKDLSGQDEKPQKTGSLGSAALAWQYRGSWKQQPAKSSTPQKTVPRGKTAARSKSHT